MEERNGEKITGCRGNSFAAPGYDQTAPSWDHDGKNITSDLTINAVYTPIPVTPATGDAFPVGLLVCIVAISFAGVLAMYPAKRRV